MDQILYWLFAGLVVACVVYMIWNGTRNTRAWLESVREAKQKVKELGFQLLAFGEVSIVHDNTVLLSFSDESDTWETECLDSFIETPFGNGVILYIHKLKDVAFLITTKGATESSFVFEK